jgi:hypothetical protein
MKVFKSIISGLFPIIMTIIGVKAIVFGEIDDSPGLMLIGLLIIVFASVFNIRRSRID